MAHTHSHSSSKTKNIFFVPIIILLGFAVIELFAGWLANSLALVSDAGHMATDGLSLVLAAVAQWIASKPPSGQHSYGLARAEVLGAWFSSLLMIGIALFIGIEALARLKHPEPVSSSVVILVGSAGLIVNLCLLWSLHREEKTLNLRGALLHIVGDLLGSLAAVTAGILIYFTGWLASDPLLSLFIAALILISSLNLLRETILVLMESVPRHLNMAKVGQAMSQVKQVRAIHDLHIWTLASGKIVLSAHVDVDDLSHWEQILNDLRKLLSEKFNITHITLQPETHSQILYPIKKQRG